MSSQQLSSGMSFYSGFTRLCKGLAFVLIGGHIVVQIFPSAVSYLALIPAKTIPFAWNLITAGYIEQSTYGLVISVVGLLFIGSLLEPVWGSRDFLKFIFVVNFLTSVCVFITAISLYYITQKEIFLYTPASGFAGALSGFLVGVKQIIPDQELPLLKIRLKWLPSLAAVGSLVASCFTNDTASCTPTILSGVYFGWVYLRFWQRKSETKVAGDPSDEFAFSTFFPTFLRPPVDVVATIFHQMFCGKRPETLDDSTDHNLELHSLPGSHPIEATRRRERGARALEERLAAEESPAATMTEETKEDPAQNV